MSNDHHPATADWLALLALTLVWGSSFILIKKALVSFNSLEVGALRISISFLVLLPFAIKRLKRVEHNKLVWFVVVGVLGSGIPPFLFAKAQTVIDSYLAGVLNSLTPLFTLLAGLLFFGTRIRWVNVAGVVIGLIGAIGLLTTVHDPGSGNGVWYGLLVVVATMCYAFNMNIIKRHLSGFDAITIASVAFVFIGIPAFIFLLSGTSFLHKITTNPQSWPSLGYVAILAIVGTAMSIVLHNWLIRRTSALFASTVTYTMPIVSIFWGGLDGELLLLVYLFWIAAILFGVYLANTGGQRKTQNVDHGKPKYFSQKQ